MEAESESESRSRHIPFKDATEIFHSGCAICRVAALNLGQRRCQQTPFHFTHCLPKFKEESVSYCEHLVECESSSRMQERLCIGNTIMLPYWLPSENKQRQRCHLLLKNDYILFERIERQLESQMLSCYIEQTMPLNEEQRMRCDSSLLNSVRELRNASGALIVDNCFQGTAARIERQCGALRRCCTAHQTCSNILQRSFLNDEKVKRLQTIRRKAKDCELGLPVKELELADALSSVRRGSVSNSSNSQASNYGPHSSEAVPLERSSYSEKKPGNESLSSSPRSESSNVSTEASILEEKKALELGLSINFNGNALTGTIQNSEVDEAIGSLIAASAASVKANEMINSYETSGTEEGSSEIDGDDNSGVYENALSTTNLSSGTQFPAIEFGGGCVDVQLLRQVLAKWYKRMIAELNEELKRATVPTRLNIQSILERFDPNNSSLFAVNSTSFDIRDYSEEDAKIADTIVNPLELPHKTSDHLVNSIDGNSVPVIEVWKDSYKGNGSTILFDKNSKESEIKWENDEYKKQIKLYRERKNRNQLFATMDERVLTPCDMYLRCRHQVVRGLDTCGVLWEPGDEHSPFGLSTESLLEIGDHCQGEGYDAFNRLYELVVARNKRLRQCLNESHLIHEAICTDDLNSESRKIADRLSAGNYTNVRECYSDANSLQFVCAQIRPCCPYFFRCREQTSDAETEREILSLTSQLTASNHRCVYRGRHFSSDVTNMNDQLKDPVSQRILLWNHPARKMAISPSSDVNNAIVRHSFPPDSKKS